MKQFFTLLIFATYLVTNAQITDLIEPKSWTNQLSETNVETKYLADVDVNTYLEEDKLFEKESQAKTLRFGAKIPTEFIKSHSGNSVQLDNGDQIWRIGFKSSGALTINFLFENYHLAPGAELYVFNHDHSMKIGPYTERENSEAGQMITWPINGDHVYLELYEPKEVVGQSSFTISNVVHGYRTLGEGINQNKALNSSGNCNIDVDCSLGDNFELQKKSVVMLVNGGGFCSGTLVNNTSGDKKPYILTANHCRSSTGQQNTGSWNIAYRFNWISPNPSCATTTNSTNGTFLQTGSGSNVLTAQGTADMVLAELSNAIPVDWDVVFAGWDRNTTASSPATGIHHPRGDIMKICREDNPLSSTIVSGFNGFNNRVWRIDGGSKGGWEQGVTEPGSSGSQLLNSDGRLIGVLSGGSAACSGTNDNGGFDFYGRLNIGWTSVGQFLDPSSTGDTTTNHLPNIDDLSVIDVIKNKELEIYPNPAKDMIFLQSEIQGDFIYQLYSSNGKLVKSGKTNLSNGISILNLPQGNYILSLNSESTDLKFNKKLIIRK